MWAIAKTLVTCEATAMEITCLITLIGIGFTLLGGGVFAFPRGPHPLQPKIYFAAKVVAWVWGAHTGKRLPNRPYGTLHSACSDFPSARCDLTGAIADSEDLE